MSVETVLETIVVSQIVGEPGEIETVVEQVLTSELITENIGPAGLAGRSVTDVSAAQASDGTVTLTFTMSDGETHVVTFQADSGGIVDPPAAVTLAGAGTARAEALAALRAALDLSGTATGFSAVTATASLSSWITLAASAEARAAATGTLAASLPLAGAGTGRGMASGEPAFRVDLAAAGEGCSAASASLTADLGLAGSATARGVAAAQVALALQCAGAAVARAQASGFLMLGNDLALQASVTATATASGMFALDVAIAGTAAGRALASASLAASLAMAGAATGRAQAAGTVSAARALSGSAAGAAAASGTITAAAPGFNVLALGPSMWIDASDAASLSLVDGKVVQATDKSGNAKHVMQSTAANQPSYTASHSVANNKPAFFNTANGNHLVMDAANTVDVTEVYIVAAYGTGVQTTFTTANGGGFGDGYAGLFSGTGSNNAPRVMGNVNTGHFITSNAFAGGAFRNRDTVAKGTGSGDPILPLPLSVMRFGRMSSIVTDRRYLMSQGAQRPWAGPFCELIAFPAALAEADRNALIEHLVAKWGIVV